MRTVFTALSVALGVSVSAFGANGTNLIGISAQSVGMGGTGVANATTGADASFKNPALLGDIPGGVGSYGLEVHGSLVNVGSSAQVIQNNVAVSGGFQNNQAATKFLPSLVATYKLDDSISLGLGLLVSGGSSVDHKGQAALTQLQTQLTLVRILPTVSYRVNEQFAFGLIPVIKYGSLAINEDGAKTGTQSSRQPHGALGYGVQVGATYKPISDLTIGAQYQSKSSVTYKDVVNFDMFGPAALNATQALATAALDDVRVQQPQEISAGAAYAMGDLKLTGDYRHIGWSSADTFRELGWQDQNVIALGAQYKLDALALRVGFNYAKSPITSISGENGTAVTDLQGHQIFARSLTILNTIAFPAYVESHVTLGAGYQITSDIVVDAAFMYAPEVSVERSGTAGSDTYANTGRVKQWSITAGVGYRL